MSKLEWSLNAIAWICTATGLYKQVKKRMGWDN